jgi:hypothetical protein
MDSNHAEGEWERVEQQLTDYLARKGCAPLDALGRAAQAAVLLLSRLPGKEPTPESGVKQGDASGFVEDSPGNPPHPQRIGGVS